MTIQVGMLAKMSAITRVTSTVGGAIAVLTGRLVVGGLLKLFPGIGTVVGGAISGSTAAALTTSFGATYIASLDAEFARNAGETPSEEEVLEEVQRRLEKC